MITVLSLYLLLALLTLVQPLVNRQAYDSVLGHSQLLASPVHLVVLLVGNVDC